MTDSASDSASRLRNILAQTKAGQEQLRRADRIMAAEDEADAIPLEESKGFAELSITNAKHFAERRLQNGEGCPGGASSQQAPPPPQRREKEVLGGP